MGCVRNRASDGPIGTKMPPEDSGNDTESCQA
jgi:hypothetical protein